MEVERKLGAEVERKLGAEVERQLGAEVRHLLSHNGFRVSGFGKRRCDPVTAGLSHNDGHCRLQTDRRPLAAATLRTNHFSNILVRQQVSHLRLHPAIPWEWQPVNPWD
ncbi:MAG: hypothetical protein R3F46_10045 [bacterium]